MRLIGFGLLAFLMAGIALFLASSETLRLGARGLSEMALGPRLVFEANVVSKPDADHTASVLRAGPRTPIILTGMPAYQAATFYMPIDARPVSGHLQIDATVQALAGTEGVLRVSIGNTKRAELLLRPGEAGRSLRIQLTQKEIAREQLVVSFTLQGQGPHTPCGIDTGIETVVEIEATSAVFLELDRELGSPRDRMLAAGRNVAIGWEAEDKAPALLAARALAKAGIFTTFDAGGMDPVAATKLAADFNLFDARPQYAWSADFASGAPLFKSRSFHRQQSWKIRYDMTKGQNRRLPRALDLHMRLGQIDPTARWQVIVTLNGSLVGDQIVSAGDAHMTLSFADKSQQRENTIEIIARSKFDPLDHCATGPELIAEIKSSTRLLPGEVDFSSATTILQDQLQNGWRLDSGLLNSAEAMAALELLALLPEPKAGSLSGPTVRVLRRGDGFPSKSNSEGLWLLYFDAKGALAARPLQSVRGSLVRELSLLIDTNGTGA